MSAQEEAKQWLAKVTKFLLPYHEQEISNANRMQAWEAMWASDLSSISEFFTEDAELSGFSPPKQTTWKGVPEIIAVLDLFQFHPTSIIFGRCSDPYGCFSISKKSSPSSHASPSTSNALVRLSSFPLLRFIYNSPTPKSPRQMSQTS